MKDHYPSEKFSDAVKSLAVGLGSLQDRVANAVTYGLIHLDGNPRMPDEISSKLKGYQDAWQGETGTIADWAASLSDDEAMEIARWVLESHWELNRLYWAD